MELLNLNATNNECTVRHEVDQHTVEHSVREITLNQRIRFDLVYCNEFPTAARGTGNGAV
jgi:hypothetical protein